MFGVKMAKKSAKAVNKEPSDIDGKLINMPVVVWNAVQTDAIRCRRNVTKQIEAILVAYFQIESVELETSRLEFVRQSEKPTVNGKEKPAQMTKEEIQKDLFPKKADVITFEQPNINQNSEPYEEETQDHRGTVNEEKPKRGRKRAS